MKNIFIAISGMALCSAIIENSIPQFSNILYNSGNIALPILAICLPKRGNAQDCVYSWHSLEICSLVPNGSAGIGTWGSSKYWVHVWGNL